MEEAGQDWKCPKCLKQDETDDQAVAEEENRQEEYTPGMNTVYFCFVEIYIEIYDFANSLMLKLARFFHI